MLLLEKIGKVFPSTASSRRSNWQKHIAKCNFNKHFTPYTTRHTFITRLAEAEVSPKVVIWRWQVILVIETTMTYYTKSSSLLLNKAILALQNNRETGKIKPVKAIHDNNDSTDNSSMIGHNSRKALIK